MMKNIYLIIITILPILFGVSTIYNLIIARKNSNNDSKKYISKARISLVFLILIYIIYGLIRNII